MSLHDDMVPTAEELAVLRFRPYRVRPSGAGYRQEFVNWDDLDDREKTEAVARLRAEKAQAKALAPADPMLDQIEHWFTYQTPTPGQIADMALLREMAKGLANQIVRVCPPSADRSAAIRLLRESLMTANASIVLGGK